MEIPVSAFRLAARIIVLSIAVMMAVLPTAVNVGFANASAVRDWKTLDEPLAELPASFVDLTQGTARSHTATETIQVRADVPADVGSAVAPKAGIINVAPSPHTFQKFDYLKSLENQGVSFIENRGQAPPEIKLYARNGGRTLWLTRDRMAFDLVRPKDGAAVVAQKAAVHGIPAMERPKPGAFERTMFSERLAGANPNLKLEPDQRQTGTFNYLTGSDRSRWHTGAHSYRLVTYRDAWKGVDLRLYGIGRDLEQEFVVKPGADPCEIRLALEGARGLSIDRDGSLVIHTAFGDLRQKKPLAYQNENNRRVAVPVSFRIADHRSFSFNIAKYDCARPLVIDPVLLYSTYLGGVHTDLGYAIAVGPNSNAYVTGFTASEDFPVSANAYQPRRKNIGFYVYNAFVTEFSAAGAMIYSTFIGGSTFDYAHAIAIDASGQAVIAGEPASSDYPVTTKAEQSSLGGVSNGFISKLSADGSELVFSTFLGGSGDDRAFGLALDSSGNVYVAGLTGSSNFPVTSGAFQTVFKGGGGYGGMPDGYSPPASTDGFVSKLSADGSTLIYSTYFGGSAFDWIFGIAVDSTGDAYVTGFTGSADLPTLNAAQPGFGAGSSKAFISKFNSAGAQLVYSTFLGGSGHDGGQAIVLDAANEAIVTGYTTSADFPTTAESFQTKYTGSGSDSFVTKLSADGSKLASSTFLGGSAYELPFGEAIDAHGDLFVSGYTSSTDFPTTPNAPIPGAPAVGAGYVSELSPDLSTLMFSTYLGGSTNTNAVGVAVDGQGNIYATGLTGSVDFPVTANAFQSQYAGETDAFVTAIGNGSLASITPSSGGNAGSVTAIISGTGFQSGATAALVSGAISIAAEQLSVSADGSEVAAIFELSGATPGTYDVKVANPGGGTFDLPGGFTVAEGGGANVSVNLVGRSVVRNNSPSNFFVNVTNSGNDDAYGVLVTFIVSSSVTVQPGFPIQPPLDLSGGVTAAQLESVISNTQQATISGQALTFLPILIPSVAAGATVSMPFQLTATALGTFDLEASVNSGWFQSLAIAQSTLSGLAAGTSAPSEMLTGSSPRCAGGIATPYAGADGPTFQDCLGAFANFNGNLLKQGLQKAGILGPGGTIDPAQITQKIASNISPMMGIIADNSLNPPARSPQALFGWALGTGWAAAEVGAAASGAASPSAMLTGAAGTALADATGITLEAMGAAAAGVAPAVIAAGLGIDIGLFLSSDASGPCKCLFVDCSQSKPNPAPQSKSSIDPNDKTGPAGAGANGYLPGGAPFSYVVSFENEPTATLPAQAVVVSDQLDPTKVNLNTLSLGSFGFGNVSITPPVHSTNYATTVDLGAQGSVADLKVDIQGSLDPASGLLKWTFQSIDASTGLPPADPTVGFLPPDTNPPAGDGQVSFTVLPQTGLANGTTISNQGVVVFDQNAPIDTPTWNNTIAAPVSQTLSVKPTQLKFSPEIVFGENGAQSKAKTITISGPKAAKGQSGQPILIESMAISAGFFVNDPNGCGNALLNPGQSCTFQVAFDPNATGDLTGQVTITDNAGNSPQTITLGGMGMAGKLSFSPASLSFRSVTVGQSSAPKTLTILNKTQALAMIGTLAPSSSEYTLSSDNCSGQALGGGKSCAVAVTFKPTATGAQNGTLAVPTNAGGTPQSVKLKGTGK